MATNTNSNQLDLFSVPTEPLVGTPEYFRRLDVVLREIDRGALSLRSDPLANRIVNQAARAEYVHRRSETMVDWSDHGVVEYRRQFELLTTATVVAAIEAGERASRPVPVKIADVVAQTVDLDKWPRGSAKFAAKVFDRLVIELHIHGWHVKTDNLFAEVEIDLPDDDRPGFEVGKHDPSQPGLVFRVEPSFGNKWVITKLDEETGDVEEVATVTGRAWARIAAEAFAFHATVPRARWEDHTDE